MFFIVPDNDKPATEEAQSTAQKSNVELDLDDAPFLEEAAEEKPAPAVEEKSESEKTDEKEKLSFKDRLKGVFGNKKKLILIGGILLLLGGGGAGAAIFFMGGEETFPVVEEKEEPQEPAQEVVHVVVPDAPHEPSAPAAPSIEIEWEAFWVPLTGPEGEIRFLVCELVIPTDNPLIQVEFAARKVTLRDAVYFYLHKQPYAQLVQTADGVSVREDIIQILNDMLQSAKIETLYFKNYYVTDP